MNALDKLLLGELNYLAPTKKRPHTYTTDPPAGEPCTTVVSDAYVVPIRNLRPFASWVSLDPEGFSLVRQDTVVTDFYDNDEVKVVYYPEVERALKEVTGADRILHLRPHRAPSPSAICGRMRPINYCGAVSRSSTCGGRSAAR